MTYSAQVYRVLIASPSDVSDERELAVKIIQEWNDANSAEREIVLLPLRWESHSAPEYGKRPQEVINRQVVDDCDFLIGIFWTRIGSPTGIADSGTLEEIERVSNEGKLVMLYFSKANKNPDDIDLEQLKKLRDFKNKTFPLALIESYSSQVEFKDKLSRQLDIQVKKMLSMSGGEVKERKESLGTDIEMNFAEIHSGENAGKSLVLKATLLNVIDEDQVPDYVPKQKQVLTSLLTSSFREKDYYRRSIKKVVSQNQYVPIRFWLTNSGIIGAKDVYIEIKYRSESCTIYLSNEYSMRNDEYSIISGSNNASTKKINDNYWISSFDLPALQPKRIVSPRTIVYLAADKSGLINIEANVYADTLAEPIVQILTIEYELDDVDISYLSLLEELDDRA